MSIYVQVYFICKKNEELLIRCNSIHLYNTRQQKNVYVTQQNSSSFQKSVYMNCTRLYNKLPLDTKGISNINIFKRRLFNFFVQKSYYTMTEYLTDNL